MNNKYSTKRITYIDNYLGYKTTWVTCLGRTCRGYGTRPTYYTKKYQVEITRKTSLRRITRLYAITHYKIRIQLLLHVFNQNSTYYVDDKVHFTSVLVSKLGRWSLNLG